MASSGGRFVTMCATLGRRCPVLIEHSLARDLRRELLAGEVQPPHRHVAIDLVARHQGVRLDAPVPPSLVCAPRPVRWSSLSCSIRADWLTTSVTFGVMLRPAYKSFDYCVLGAGFVDASELVTTSPSRRSPDRPLCSRVRRQ